MGRFGRHNEDERIGELSHKCSICGNPASAFWIGHEDVQVCSICAVEVLPKLIADAIYSPGPGNHARYHSSLKTFETIYWQSATLNIDTGKG